MQRDDFDTPFGFGEADEPQRDGLAGAAVVAVVGLAAIGILVGVLSLGELVKEAGF